MNQALFSSATVEWETPQAVFDALNDEFHFTLDPCSTDENAKCAKHFTRRDDGLKQDWTGEAVFCNPPYGREMPLWVAKCAEHGKRGGGGGHVDSGADRHQIFSRLHLSQSRNPFHPWTAEIRGREKQRPLSVHDRCVRAVTYAEPAIH